MEELADLGPVVVLIDEYDKPLLDHLEHIEIAKENQLLLKNFYGTLKGLDKQLRFVLATEVTKFSKVSLFSGFNNLKDITLHPDYATLLGYTASDLQNFLGEQIQGVVERRRSTGEAVATDGAVLAEMKEWYNGYRFAWGAEPVYNPHSTLNFLDTGRVQDYWFETGASTLLVQQVRKQPRSVMNFRELVTERNSPLNVDNLTQLDLIPLIWQTGYLTIREYDAASRRYRLDFPNREVREAFFQTLVKEFAELCISDVDRVAAQGRQQLEQRELSPFIKTIRSLFATIPNTLFTKQSEAFYHAVFLIILEVMGLKVQAEVLTSLGRIDLTIEMKNCIYIMELKFNTRADTALKQIERKDYKQIYAIEEKDLILMGIRFSTEERNIWNCKAIIYSKDGSESEEIDVPV